MDAPDIPRVDLRTSPDIEGLTVYIDKTGLPLIPQPTNSRFDPLNYPNWLKYLILAEASVLASLATLNVAIINPAVVPLAQEFNITDVVGTYQTAIAIGTSAFGPLLFTPFARVYGRRPVYLATVLIGMGTAIASARSTSFKQLVVIRAFTGFVTSAPTALGPGTVVDLFFMHQRGKAMGFFTLIFTSGGHLAPILGGYIARSWGWRWCYWVAGILNASLVLICFFFMPETLFDRPEDVQVGDSSLSDTGDEENENGKKERDDSSSSSRPGILHVPPPMSFKTYLNRLSLWSTNRPPTRHLKAVDFVVRPLRMLKYPSVTIPALYYSVTYGFASIEPALTVATLFAEVYKFNTVRNGLANGITLLVGTGLGELCSGPVTDRMMSRARLRAHSRGTEVPAEVRLRGIWTGAILTPIGLIIYGLTIHFGTNFIIPCVGMTVAAFGIQIITSVCYTYSCSDCYRTQSNDVSQCFNVFRQLFGLTLGFYSIPFGHQVGFEWSFTLFAALCIVTFGPLMVLMYKGEKWRRALGEPKDL